MSKRIYQELLKGDLKTLGYYVDELYEAKLDFEFFQIIAKFIVPLLRQSTAFEQFYFKYIKDKDAYLKLHAELESKAPEEVEQALLSLKADLELSGLLNDANIKHRLDDIVQTFTQKERYGMPSYLEETHERQRQLLEQILDSNTIDIVQKYATISYRNHLVWNEDMHKHEEIKKPHIDKFIFASSLIRIQELNSIWWALIDQSWVAWEYLVLVEWCWNTPFSFFDDKIEKYDDYQSRNVSVQLLSLHNYWVQINKIKESVSQDQVSGTFSRETFVRYLKLILNEIVLEQETNSIPLNEIVLEEESFEPHCIEQLRLSYTKLFLDVQWFQGGRLHAYLVHTFQDGKKRQIFMASLLEAPIGQKISISTDKNPGGNIAKYLKDANLNNILGALFFERVNTFTVSMKCKSIKGKDISKSERSNLKNFIKKKLIEIPF